MFLFIVLPLLTKSKNMKDQKKFNKEVDNKIRVLDGVVEKIDGKLTELGSLDQQMIQMLKMMDIHVALLVDGLQRNDGRFPRQILKPNEELKAVRCHLKKRLMNLLTLLEQDKNKQRPHCLAPANSRSGRMPCKAVTHRRCRRRLSLGYTVG